jgi:hypothetical protein
MKRDDHAMEPESELSTDERALCGEMLGESAGAIERAEGFLFVHLECARRARMRMDRMKTWNMDYVNEYRTRELALAGAERHYRQLQNAGAPVPELLARMFLAEGVKP